MHEKSSLEKWGGEMGTATIKLKNMWCNFNKETQDETIVTVPFIQSDRHKSLSAFSFLEIR